MLIEGPGHDNLHEVNKRKGAEASLSLRPCLIRTTWTTSGITFLCLCPLVCRKNGFAMRATEFFYGFKIVNNGSRVTNENRHVFPFLVS